MSTQSAPALLFWDAKRANIASIPDKELALYRIKKKLALALHKLQAILEARKDLELICKAKEMQMNNPEIMEMIQEMHKHNQELPIGLKKAEKELMIKMDFEKLYARLKDRINLGAKILPYLQSQSGGPKEFGYHRAASFPMQDHLAEEESLIGIYLMLEDLDELEGIELLMNLLNDQLKIQSENIKILDAANRAKASMPKKQDQLKDLLESADRELDPEKLEMLGIKIAKAMEAIKEREEKIAAISEIIPQKMIRFDGPSSYMENRAAALRAGEIYGNALMDAHLQAQKCGSSQALSKAQKLLHNFSLNKSGSMGEAIAASFPGFPEAEDLIQDGFLLLAEKQAKQGSDISMDAGLANQAILFGWGHSQEEARSLKRDRLAHMLGLPSGPSNSHEAEASDPLEALDNQGIWELAEKCCTEKQLAAIRLCYRDEYSKRQAAEILGIKKQSLHETLRAAEKKLAAALLA